MVAADCRKIYTPREISVNHLYLTVDGIINMGVNNISSFKLTRSQMLNDTTPSIPELGATVAIQSADGSAGFILKDTGSNGIYVSDPLTLDVTRKYILSVISADGEKYASDTITPKQTPPIDSLSWTLGFDGASNSQVINIYTNTHDPSGNTKFYRWDFTDTWEHESILRSNYLIINSIPVYNDDSTKHNWHCWSNALSTNILVGTSAGLSGDVISQAQINRIYQNDPRLDVKYSILVRQYALDATAYDYWSQVKQQSQSLGGLFDIIPAQLKGNMHNLTVPSEPVYGYISASTVQQQRLFISNQDLPGWKSVPRTCDGVLFTPDPAFGQVDSIYYNIDPNFSFYDKGHDAKGNEAQILMPTACLDCTFQGGSTIRPSFWQ